MFTSVPHCHVTSCGDVEKVRDVWCAIPCLPHFFWPLGLIIVSTTNLPWTFIFIIYTPREMGIRRNIAPRDIFLWVIFCWILLNGKRTESKQVKMLLACKYSRPSSPVYSYCTRWGDEDGCIRMLKFSRRNNLPCTPPFSTEIDNLTFIH